jgi:hypothetical protein
MYTVSKYQVHQVDGNQRAIVEALEHGGCSVEKIGRPLDLLVGTHGKSYVFEVKLPKGKLRATQVRFLAQWKGHAGILRSVEDALAFLREATSKSEPPRCPKCGCYQFVYKGDRQVCADCGR